MTVDASELVVSPAEVAAARKITNPSQAQLDSIADAIADAQADVLGYLKRDTLMPREETLTELMPAYAVDVTSWRAWPQARALFDDTIAVKEATARPDGSYDVTFYVGLNGMAERPIVRYVKAHALRLLREDESYGFPLDRVVTSLSAEGQSIQFVARPNADGEAGSLPNIKTLSRYRRLGSHRAPSRSVSLWPNGGSVVVGAR